MLGAVVSAVIGAIQAVTPWSEDPLVDPTEHVLLTLLAVLLLTWIPGHLALGRDSGGVGRAGGVLVAVGMVLLTIGATSSNLHNEDYAWFPVVAVPANAGWLVGSILLAVAAWRRRTLPRVLAAALPLAWLTSVVLSQLGANLAAALILGAVGWLYLNGPASSAPASSASPATSSAMPR